MATVIAVLLAFIATFVAGIGFGRRQLAGQAIRYRDYAGGTPMMLRNRPVRVLSAREYLDMVDELLVHRRAAAVARAARVSASVTPEDPSDARSTPDPAPLASPPSSPLAD